MYTGSHIYLTFGGPLGNPEFDNWQVGLRINAAGGSFETLPTVAQLTSFYNTPLAAFVGSTGAAISSSAFLKYVKAAAIDRDGHYLQDAVIYEASSPTPGAGGSPGAASPQDSAVISLWSGQNLGKGNHGRIYLPWCTRTVDSGGKMSGSATMLTAAQTFINAVNTAAKTWGTGNPTAEVSIMSSIGDGTTKRAAVIKVGDVKDTQRRRRNGLTETYVSGNIT